MQLKIKKLLSNKMITVKSNFCFNDRETGILQQRKILNKEGLLLKTAVANLPLEMQNLQNGQTTDNFRLYQQTFHVIVHN